jgi:hypothetical protein
LRRNGSAEKRVSQQPFRQCRWEYRNRQAVVDSPDENLQWIIRCTPDGPRLLTNEHPEKSIPDYEFLTGMKVATPATHC